LQDYEIHFLAYNFPQISDSAAVKSPDNYWSIVDKLQTDDLDSAIILSYNYAEKFRGPKSTLPHHFRWITFDPAEKTFLLSATKISGDSLHVRIGNTRAEKTEFYTRLVSAPMPLQDFYKLPSGDDSIAVVPGDTLFVDLYFNERFEYDSKIVSASLKAIEAPLNSKMIIRPNPKTDISGRVVDWAFWLSDEPIPQKIKIDFAFRFCASSENISLVTHINSANLYCRQSENVTWIITQRLNEKTALNENFTLTLASILGKEKAAELKRTLDHRAFLARATWSESADKNPRNQITTGSKIEPYLAILMFVTLLAERWVAFKRNQ
jgi:hypothetical protein